MVLRACAILLVLLVLLGMRPATADDVCLGVAVDAPGEPSAGPVCVSVPAPVMCHETGVGLPPAPTVVVWRCLPY